MNQKNNLIVKILLIALMTYRNLTMKIDLNFFYRDFVIKTVSGDTRSLYEDDDILKGLEFTSTQYERIQIEIDQQMNISDPNVIRYNQNLIYRPKYSGIVHYYDSDLGITVANFISPCIPLTIYVNIITPKSDTVNNVSFLSFVDNGTKTMIGPFNILSFFKSFSWTDEIIQEYKQYQKYPGLTYYKNEEVTDFNLESTSVNFKDPFWVERLPNFLKINISKNNEKKFFKGMKKYFNDYFAEILETLKQIHTDQAVSNQKYDELKIEFYKIKELFDKDFLILDFIGEKKTNKDTDQIKRLKDLAQTLFTNRPDTTQNLINAEEKQMKSILNQQLAPLAMIYYAAKSKMRTITKNQDLDSNLEWSNRYNDEENEINPEEFFTDFFLTNDKLLYIIFSETNRYYLNHPIIIMLKNKIDVIMNLISDFKNKLRDSIENEEDYDSMAPFDIYDKIDTVNEAFFSGNPNFNLYRNSLNCLLYTSPSPRD